MLKIAAFLVVPGALGGLSLLHDPVASPPGRPTAQLIEVGVTFDEAAVRDILPEGFTPSSTFTGGLALYVDQDGRDVQPATLGYVWIDINYRGSARYVVRSFPAADQPSQGEPAVQAVSYHSLGADIIDAAAGSAAQGGLAISVEPLPATCHSSLAQASPYVFVQDSSGKVGLSQSPVFSRWCDADLLGLDLQAATDDPLSRLEPRQVNWVGLATPLE